LHPDIHDRASIAGVIASTSQAIQSTHFTGLKQCHSKNIFVKWAQEKTLLFQISRKCIKEKKPFVAETGQVFG
jgi:hypothetical protein